MKITTTKKIKGVLQLPSIGAQLSYDHIHEKPQIITVDNKKRMNMDIQAASDLKMIVLSDYEQKPQPEEDFFNDEPVAVPTVVLANLTPNPMLICVDGQKVELPGNGKARFPVTILENPHIMNCLDKKIKVIDEDGVLSTPEVEEVEESVEDSIEQPEEPEPESTAKTVPVVVNPNNEKMPKTEGALKNINVKTKKAKAPKKDSSIKVYSPQELPPEAEEKDTVPFVDKEQEEERVKARQGISDTKVVESERLEGTTPMVVKRTPRKARQKTVKAEKAVEKAVDELIAKLTPEKEEKPSGTPGIIFDTD